MARDDSKVSLSGLENEILSLTDQWYREIGHDHHKDRDCHFEVVEQWSYGNKPTYYVQHFGYVAGEWYLGVYPDNSFETRRQALYALRAKLLKMLEEYSNANTD